MRVRLCANALSIIAFASRIVGFSRTVSFESTNKSHPIVLEGSNIHKTSEGFSLKDWSQKRIVKKKYDLTASIYDLRYMEEQEAKYKAALDTLTLVPTSVILDVGCGTGLLFRHVVNNAETVVGVDISKKLLLEARNRTKSFANVHLVLADGDYLPFRSHVFDGVFLFTMIQNMPSPQMTLKAAIRTTKKNAQIVVTGLKKVFSIQVFDETLRQAGFHAVSIINDDVLKCYVAICRLNLD
jgi:ubiquinone/menaquinone biosynthesis C-methylase UbiE